MEEKIKEDLKQSQLAKDALKVSTLRMLLSEMKYAQIKKGDELTDEDVVSVVQREIKKRQESIEAFEKAGRSEMAENEKAETEILKTYLPPQMSEEEVSRLVDEAVVETGATSAADMGKVIGLVMKKVGQAAPGSVVSALVKQKLTS